MVAHTVFTATDLVLLIIRKLRIESSNLQNLNLSRINFNGVLCRNRLQIYVKIGMFSRRKSALIKQR